MVSVLVVALSCSWSPAPAHCGSNNIYLEPGKSRLGLADRLLANLAVVVGVVAVVGTGTVAGVVDSDDTAKGLAGTPGSLVVFVGRTVGA